MVRSGKVVCIGGGPGGLYFAILLKKARPELEIEVLERNRPDDTFGWGVVFSDETLSNFEERDPESFRAIRESFINWSDIHTWFRDTCVVSTGHGFCGLARKALLQILQARAIEVGVELRFQEEVTSLEPFAQHDLIVASDGINSFVREQYAEHFRPSLDWRECKFTWLGTDKPLDAFTFVFRENEHGLFRVHAYPFQRDLSTFIVECREETWKRAGLDAVDEAGTVRYFEELFADHLEGHRLLTNRSIWRTFPTVRNECWHHGNVVLLGDAAHTAHFSIGSGTKLAMEDAIALCDAFEAHGFGDVPATLAAYQEERWVDVLKIQKAAQTSLEWFEQTERYAGQDPLPFTFNLMTRSKRITYDNLGRRDPELIERVRDDYARRHDALHADGTPPAPCFVPLRLRELELANRIVVSPMCQYSATDGLVGDWHLVHLGARAVGGAGLVMTEMTDVSEEGRITHGCAGLYRDEHADAWRRIVDFCHANSGAAVGIQLAHAGRKASCSLPWEGDEPLRDGSAWEAIGPSALPFDEGWPTPREMDRAEMDRVRDAFVAAARRAEAAGFDLVELHFAHGYLLSSFLSPASNVRTDEYGGSLENRMRYPLEVFDAVREVWPAARPLGVRISATDWLPKGEGFDEDEGVVLSRALLEHGCDLVDVSTAGNTPRSQPEYGRMYQVPFAERIKYEVGIPVMAVGAIQHVDHANTVLAAGRADLCAMARPHLVNPSLTLAAAVQYEEDEHRWPVQYLAAKPRPREES